MKMKMKFGFSPREHPILTILLGIIFIALGATFVMQDIQFRMAGTETYATIVEFREVRRADRYERDVLVSYEVDGISHEQVLGHSTEGMSLGDRVRIRYMTDDPTEIMSAEGIWFAWVGVVGGFGTVAVGIRYLPPVEAKIRSMRRK